MTSHDAVDALRRLFGTRKIGHTGTLDPGAAGVLPICVGRATRLVQYMQGADKAYRAEITLGVETDTLDAAGATTRVTTSFSMPAARLGDVLTKFTGVISQVPPMVSSIKVGGERLHRLARRGEEVARPARTVWIHDLKLRKVWSDDALHLEFGTRILLDVRCSKGTYIRSLAHDIGRELGCGAHLTFLVRTQSGPFYLEESVTFEELAAQIAEGGVESVLQPMASGIAHMPRVDVSPEDARRIGYGQAIPAPTDARPDTDVRVHEAATGRLLAVARVERLDGKPVWRPHCVLAPAGEGRT